MRNVKFELIHAVIADEPILRVGNQIIPTARRYAPLFPHLALIILYIYSFYSLNCCHFAFFFFFSLTLTVSASLIRPS